MKQVAPDIQESFDSLFPKHKGHMLEKAVVITELSAPFECSCGETLRVTVGTQMFRPEGKPFSDYLMACQKELTEEYNRLSSEASKLGYMLINPDSLLKLIERANLKEGEQI